MTEEMFNALAPFEDIFNRVKARQYQPYPGLPVLQTMLAAIKEYRPNYRTNLGCSSCVRSMVLECAGLYFTEKAARAAKTPVQSETSPEPTKTPKPRKKSAKSKKSEE